ncbi:MAG: prepilin-type N-terminal cleavage/methylation domain-containing protein [Eubacterium sp.]|nr:prepilin-type N-terminal cleavage/methylation domain-containing protein [Eubacterium sp.]
MKNKGFSLVELIIVIAIMAILAAAIAPALIRYIDKSRKSDDVAAAETVGTAVNAALANEDAYSEAAPKMDGSTTVWSAAGGATLAGTEGIGGTFGQEMSANLGGEAPKVKYNKDGNTDWTVAIQQSGKALVYKGSVELQPDIDASYK